MVTRRRFVLGALLTAAVVAVAGCTAGPRAPSVSSHAVPSEAASPATTPSASASHSAAPNVHRVAPAPTRDVFVFPVVGHYSYARVHHDYPATDIIAPCGSK